MEFTLLTNPYFLGHMGVSNPSVYPAGSLDASKIMENPMKTAPYWGNHHPYQLHQLS
jgi:hypothetical protein